MKIISWNVNGLRANVKKGGFDWFINESPDIYCIQETKAQAEQLEEGIRNLFSITRKVGKDIVVWQYMLRNL